MAWKHSRMVEALEEPIEALELTSFAQCVVTGELSTTGVLILLCTLIKHKTRVL